MSASAIIDHLGGECFLVNLGARDFVIDETNLSFTLIHDKPSGVRSVSITITANEEFLVTCYGRIMPGALHAPVLGKETVDIPENLASVVGRLIGIDALRDRHL